VLVIALPALASTAARESAPSRVSAPAMAPPGRRPAAASTAASAAASASSPPAARDARAATARRVDLVVDDEPSVLELS